MPDDRVWTLHFVVDAEAGGARNAIVSGPLIRGEDPVVRVVPGQVAEQLRAERNENAAEVRRLVVEYSPLLQDRADEIGRLRAALADIRDELALGLVADVNRVRRVIDDALAGGRENEGGDANG